MEYNIKSIETVYKNIYFRSRLEATWAAFFDIVGWQWEYEPCDLYGWFPDFSIKSKYGDKKEILVEVKPYDLTAENQSIHKDLEKISNALGHNKEMLFLGRKPFETNETGLDNVCIGLLVKTKEFGFYEQDNALMNYNPLFGFDICDELMSYSMRLTGQYDGNQWPAETNVIEYAFGLAKKQTQYNPKKPNKPRRTR